MYSAAISNVQDAVQLQSTRAKGAGRQVTQVRVEVGSVTNARNGIVFFDKIGKAVMYEWEEKKGGRGGEMVWE